MGYIDYTPRSTSNCVQAVLTCYVTVVTVAISAKNEP